ncbi:UvrD-helicase domain-containing protein [Epidermidibacterium keratini]|uniref:DNA 3'-5' helicase n=1 Tax=Epidermidibacterium keratini TaxID=1891644 RepID=A0A7L4YRC3_9ACTN|nr:ATP-dependent DNA helicase [Epidermidibacterium keratini]QHC01598.1 UvrD-helicase domain-containing protein [Epidermidibacterium keratini]
MSRTDAADVPAVRLVRPRPAPAAALRDDEAQREVIAHRRGVLRVIGGPGTGKTLTLARAAAGVLDEGADADEVLVLAFSRKSAARLRDQVVAHTGAALREVPVRSFESFAWANLERAARDRPEWSTPRLITGPEQDLIIRELLAGSLLGEGQTDWPDALRAALPTRGFATEVRDALMRCAERGISAEQLRSWAASEDRPEWASLASFMGEYNSVAGLRQPDSYDPAELVRALVELWRRSPDQLDRATARLRYVYVDEAQDLDTAKIELLELISSRVESLVLAGDPDQSVFGFRGADPYAFTQFDPEAERVLLPRTYRAGGPLSEVYADWAAQLAGPAEQRRYISVVDDADGSESLDVSTMLDVTPPVEIVTAPIAGREAAEIAAVLRKRHLVDEVPWREMAVLTRSVRASLPALRRAFQSAEVPLALGIDELPVGQNAAVRALIGLVEVALAEAPEAVAIEEVLRSPYFRLGALELRGLRRALRQRELSDGGARSSRALLESAVLGELDVADEPATRELVRMVSVLDGVRREAADGASAEELLYRAWELVGVESRWRAEALRGGSAGESADSRLDGIVAMFDAAATFSTRMQGATFDQFVDYLEAQELPADRLSKGGRDSDAVVLLSANSAKGLQWDTVCLIGVQDGRWPNTVPRDTILGADAIVDLAAGRAARDVDRRKQMLLEERRLFYLAASRARNRLVVSAVDGVDDRPSRFVHELARIAGVAVRSPSAREGKQYSMVDLIAELRTCLLDPQSSHDERASAAHNLARLAAEGVPGASPEDWYGTTELSDPAPIVSPEEIVTISPSAAVTFQKCGLRWFFDQVGRGSSTINASVGTLVHEAFSRIEEPAGRSHAELFNEMHEHVARQWPTLSFDSPWEDRMWSARVQVMLDNLAGWLEARTAEWVGNEITFELEDGGVRVRGTVDRLERTADGVLTIDLKTGKSAPTPDELESNAQLGLYQLAVEEGAFERPQSSGGAELLFVHDRAKAKDLPQQPLAQADDPTWAQQLLVELGEGMSAGSFAAVNGPLCRSCDFKQGCPIGNKAEDQAS